MAKAVTPSTLPITSDEWDEDLKVLKLGDKTIHSGQYNKSGSKITRDQFTLLRVLWICKEGNEIAKKINGMQLTEANVRLNEFVRLNTDWARYLDSIQMQTSRVNRDFDKLGLFGQTRQFQLAIKEVNPDKDSPDDQDEPDNTPTSSASAGGTDTQLASSMRALNIKGKGKAVAGKDTDTAREGPKTRAQTKTRSTRRTDQKTVPLVPSTPVPSRRKDMLFVPDVTPVKQLDSTVHSTGIWLASPQQPTLQKETEDKNNDEEAVNVALVVFLDALTLHYGIPGEWSARRNEFSFGQKIFVARTDGYLRLDQGKKMCAIVEVKAAVRNGRTGAKIKMQESAEMAAWISQCPPDDGELARCRANKKIMSRLLVSQDYDEIYLTIAEFDADYVDFVCGRTKKTKSFLTMNEYGPYKIFSMSSMRAFSQFIIALILQEMAA